MVRVADFTKSYPLLDDQAESRLTPESRQQPYQRLGNALMGQLMNFVLVPGDDFPRRIPRRIWLVLALQQHQ